MSVNQIPVQELKMKCVCSMQVQHFLTREKMGLHLWLAEENLKKLQDLDYRYCESDTVDESWIHQYDPKLKRECEMSLRKGE